MKIETAEIAEIIKKMRPAISAKSTDLGSDFIHIIPDAILTFGDNIAVISETSLGEIKGSYNSKDFSKAISSIKDESLSFSSEDGKLILKSKSTKVELVQAEKTTTRNAISIYNSVMASVQDWVELDENTLSGLLVAAETASTDIKDCELSCVAIRGGFIEATDNYRVTVCETLLKKDAILPASSLKQILRGNKISHIAIGEGSWVCFYSEESGLVFAIHSVWVEEYPKVAEAAYSWMPKENGAEKKFKFPEEIIGIAKDISDFCDNDGKFITIKFFTDKITCSAQKETAKITRKLKNNSGLESGEIRINPFLIASFISDLDDCYVFNDKAFFVKNSTTHIIGLAIWD